MTLPAAVPPHMCSPDAFRTFYRLNARMALRLDQTLYLCVLRAPDHVSAHALKEHIEKHWYHGELYCEMEPGQFYAQVYAPNEDAVRLLLEDVTDCVPGVRVQFSSVSKGE